MRFRDFTAWDAFPATRSRQRDAVRWLQKRILRAFSSRQAPPKGFFGRLLNSDVGVDCLLRIVDSLGIAATDLVYDFAWTENIHRLRYRTESLQKAVHKNLAKTPIDRVLRAITPMEIAAAEEAMAAERRADTAERYRDIYRYIELIVLRWKQLWTAQDVSRSNPLDSWFLARHQAALWDFFGNRCSRCRAQPPQFRDRTIDHAFIPFSRGGTFVIFDPTARQWWLNAVPLCRSCNSAKGHRPIESFFTADELQRIRDLLQRYPLEVPSLELPDLE
jgi:5-methylcytosine-specific restriction endonuclease McrA